MTLDESFEDIRVHFVKIDVEGGEADVIQGARKLIQRDVPTMMVEVAEFNQERVWSMLVERAGYLALSPTGEMLLDRSAQSGNTFFVQPEKLSS